LAKNFVKAAFATPHLCGSSLTDLFAKPDLRHNMAKVMAKVMALPPCNANTNSNNFPLKIFAHVSRPLAKKNWESLARR